MIRFQFVEDHRTDYPVKRMCEVLKLNASSFYKWRKARAARNTKTCEDSLLAVRILSVFNQFNGCYGAKRIAAEISDQYEPVNHKRVARLMTSMNLRGYSKKRKVKTTISRKDRSVFPDLVTRNFTADRPNKVYVGDITYLPIKGGGNMYLATVIDCFSRKLTGFALADHMRTDLVGEALAMAKDQRGSLEGAIFHSDHGSVYTSQVFQQQCKSLGVTQSMGGVGTSADNALAESFNATLKREVLQDRKVFETMLQCRKEVFSWCVRYNTTRRHSYLKYCAPNTFEAQAFALKSISAITA